LACGNIHSSLKFHHGLHLICYVHSPKLTNLAMAEHGTANTISDVSAEGEKILTSEFRNITKLQGKIMN
jgi:hypothetical protein